MIGTRTDKLNALAATCAIVAAVAAATIGQDQSAVTARGLAPDRQPGAEFVTLEDGTRALLDAQRTPIPLRPYRRIASGSSVADWLLVEFCEPERIRSVTRLSQQGAPWRHRFAGKDTLASLGDIEALLSLKPDLLIVDSFGDPKRVARLREAGLPVFDIGQMRGLTTLWPTIERIGALCGRHARAQGEVWARRRLVRSLAADIPPERRARALYLSSYGDKLFGGTRGTGYHDLLHHAGLRDAAASEYRNFPEYSAEQVLSLDPDIIVTRADMGAPLCRHAGLATLRACQTPGAIIELESFALDDPGQGLLESIQALYRVVHEQAADLE